MHVLCIFILFLLQLTNAQIYSLASVTRQHNKKPDSVYADQHTSNSNSNITKYSVYMQPHKHAALVV